MALSRVVLFHIPSRGIVILFVPGGFVGQLTGTGVGKECPQGDSRTDFPEPPPDGEFVGQLTGDDTGTEWG